jgi:hypothetical protein
MKTNETNSNELSLMEGAEIEGAELESIAASLPVRTKVRAGAALPCHPCNDPR